MCGVSTSLRFPGQLNGWDPPPVHVTILLTSPLQRPAQAWIESRPFPPCRCSRICWHSLVVTCSVAPLPDAKLRSVRCRRIRIVLPDHCRRSDRCVRSWLERHLHSTDTRLSQRLRQAQSARCLRPSPRVLLLILQILSSGETNGACFAIQGDI